MSTKHSKKYNKNLQTISDFHDQNSHPTIEQAIELLTQLDQPNFKNGVSLEIHAKLNINPTKSDQFVRGSVVLPHGTGKEVTIAAFVTPENEEKAKKAGATIVGGEELIEEIKKNGKINFDTAVAQPEMMKKLPVIARILGTAGVMPNPKTGTVGDNIEEIITLIKKGKVDYKNDKSGNIHFVCGKIGVFDKEQLIQNVQTAIDAIEKSKPDVIKKKFILSIHLATSQSPSIRIV